MSTSPEKSLPSTCDDVGKPPLSQTVQYLQTFAAGGIAGAVSRTLTAPLDRVKVLIQEGHNLHKMIQPKKPDLAEEARSYRRLPRCEVPSITDVMRHIHSEDGLVGFWRGNGINCMKAGPEFAVVFSVRKLYNSALEARRTQEREALTAWRLAKEKQAASVDSDGSTDPAVAYPLYIHADLLPEIAGNFVVGAASGATAQIMLYPLELLKTRISVAKKGEFQGGLREVIQYTYRNGGIREFYRGLAPNLVGIVPYRGLEVGLFFTVQQNVLRRRRRAVQMSERAYQRDLKRYCRRRRDLRLVRDGRVGELSTYYCMGDSNTGGASTSSATGTTHRLSESEKQQLSNTKATMTTTTLAHAALVPPVSAPRKAVDATLLTMTKEEAAAELATLSPPEVPPYRKALLGCRRRHAIAASSSGAKQLQEEEAEDARLLAEGSCLSGGKRLPVAVVNYEEHLSMYETAMIGTFASIVAQTATYPLNVVRTRLQTQGVNNRPRMYNGMFDCFRHIIKKDGPQGLFRGLLANYLKAVPASAITFVAFEEVNKFFAARNLQ